MEQLPMGALADVAQAVRDALGESIDLTDLGNVHVQLQSAREELEPELELECLAEAQKLPAVVNAMIVGWTSAVDRIAVHARTDKQLKQLHDCIDVLRMQQDAASEEVISAVTTTLIAAERHVGAERSLYAAPSPILWRIVAHGRGNIHPCLGDAKLLQTAVQFLVEHSEEDELSSSTHTRIMDDHFRESDRGRMRKHLNLSRPTPFECSLVQKVCTDLDKVSSRFTGEYNCPVTHMTATYLVNALQGKSLPCIADVVQRIRALLLSSESRIF
jgi:hypothetical protein